MSRDDPTSSDDSSSSDGFGASEPEDDLSSDGDTSSAIEEEEAVLVAVDTTHLELNYIDQDNLGLLAQLILDNNEDNAMTYLPKLNQLTINYNRPLDQAGFSLLQEALEVRAEHRSPLERIVVNGSIIGGMSWYAVP